MADWLRSLNAPHAGAPTDQSTERKKERRKKERKKERKTERKKERKDKAHTKYGNERVLGSWISPIFSVLQHANFLKN